MRPFDYAILVMATWHAVEVWHHGSIFAELRARLEDTDGFFPELMSCAFCLSLWTGLGLVCWHCLTSNHWLCIPIYALAVTRGANLANDIAHRWCRTPRNNQGYDD